MDNMEDYELDNVEPIVEDNKDKEMLGEINVEVVQDFHVDSQNMD